MIASNWQVFRERLPRVEAEALARTLAASDVPSIIESRSLEGALESSFSVLVSSGLAHRARWVVAQHVPSEAELSFLATGHLPGEDQP